MEKYRNPWATEGESICTKIFNVVSSKFGTNNSYLDLDNSDLHDIVDY